MVYGHQERVNQVVRAHRKQVAVVLVAEAERLQSLVLVVDVSGSCGVKLATS